MIPIDFAYVCVVSEVPLAQFYETGSKCFYEVLTNTIQQYLPWLNHLQSTNAHVNLWTAELNDNIMSMNCDSLCEL